MLERTIEDETESGDEEKMEISDEENDFPPLPQKGRHGGGSILGSTPSFISSHPTDMGLVNCCCWNYRLGVLTINLR